MLLTNERREKIYPRMCDGSDSSDYIDLKFVLDGDFFFFLFFHLSTTTTTTIVYSQRTPTDGIFFIYFIRTHTRMHQSI